MFGLCWNMGMLFGGTNYILDQQQFENVQRRATKLVWTSHMIIALLNYTCPHENTGDNMIMIYNYQLLNISMWMLQIC